jgi:hypothetical protein
MRSPDAARKSAVVRGLLPLFGGPHEARFAHRLALPAALLGMLLALAPDTARGQIDGIGDPVDPGPAYTVSGFSVRYLNPHPDQPPLSSILPLTVLLGEASSGLIAPSPDRPQAEVRVGVPGEPRDYHASAIGSISSSVLAALQQRGLLGVYVQPDPADIDIETERDLRPPGQTELRLIITTARVRALRTIAAGDRVKEEWRIDNAMHDRIRLRSPIQPTGADNADSTDLIDGDVLDEYLFRLNRHPGRRVNAALAPAEDGRGVSLDFLVNESKPWYAYAQVSNTGTDATNKWQQRFGYVNNQLLGRDDILSFEYFRAGLDDLNGVSLSYDAPWFDSPRPWWWGTPSEGPDWLSAIDRSKLPWFGNDFLRWRLFGSYTSYTLDLDLGAAGKETIDGKDWNVGAQLTYNFFQHRAFFLDVFGGLEGRGVEVDNSAAVSTASRFFLLPQAGVRAQRVNPISTLFANVVFEGNVKSATDEGSSQGGNPSGGIEALGRANPDDKWFVMKGDFAFSQFLEPIFNPSAWEDPSTPSSSTLAHEVALGARGQYAFGSRLIPQAEQVAGGLYSVRGYDQSAAVGDNLIIGTFEYRFHLPHSLPVAREPTQLPLLGDFRVAPQQVYGRADWDLILRAFIDTALTSSNERPNADLEPSEFLLGTGVGTELVIRNNLRARVDWGIALKSNESPTTRVDAGDHQFHLLFTVLY